MNQNRFSLGIGNFLQNAIRPHGLMPPATDFQSCWDYVAGEFEKQITLWFGDSATFDLGDFGTDNSWLIGIAIGERLETVGHAEFECLPNRANANPLNDPRAPTVKQLLAQLSTQVIA